MKFLYDMELNTKQNKNPSSKRKPRMIKVNNSKTLNHMSIFISKTPNATNFQTFTFLWNIIKINACEKLLRVFLF